MKKTTLTFSFLIASFLVTLGYMSYAGSLWATIVGIAIFIAVIFFAGAGIAVYVVKIMQTKQQQDFMLNAKENLAIMQQQQNLMNSQNQQLMRQVKQAPDNGQFLIEDGIFEELDN